MMIARQIERAVEVLKGTGVRMTPQRYAILAYLLETKSHPSADEIYKALEGRFPSMSVATVYNNLKLFKEAGLIRELTFGDHASRFDGNMHDHYHITCTSCGRIEDFEYAGLDEVEHFAANRTGFLPQHHRMEVYGLCPDCQKKMAHQH